MRGLVRDLMMYTLGIAVLVVILEHAGGFSTVLGASSRAYSSTFNTLTGHGAK